MKGRHGRDHCQWGDREDRERGCEGYGEPPVTVTVTVAGGRGRRPCAHTGHEQDDGGGEDHECRETGHDDPEEAGVVDRSVDVRGLDEEIGGEPGADEQEAAPRSNQQRDRTGDRKPLDDARDPEMLPQREQDVVQMVPVVQLCAVDPAEEIPGPSGEPHGGCG